MLSVKGIFKTLIGTILVMVFSSIIIEVFNVNTTGLQVNQIAKLAGKQSADLFSQESYKDIRYDDDKKSNLELADVMDSDGNKYISGNFYSGLTGNAAYRLIYTSNGFKNWIKDDKAVEKGDWYNIKLLNRALNKPESLEVAEDSPDYNDAIIAKTLVSMKVTPLNLGIPYLDKGIVTNMFKWNVAQLFSNCNPELIKKDSAGKSYVLFKGFRVYASEAKITSLEYKTYDLTKTKDRDEFNRITNIDPDNLGFEYDKALGSTISKTDDERSRVCLVGINYSIPISYEGITPIKNIFNFVWNNEVKGFDGNESINDKQAWSDSTENLESGGLTGNTSTSGVLPIPGKLIYYVIR